MGVVCPAARMQLQRQHFETGQWSREHIKCCLGHWPVLKLSERSWCCKSTMTPAIYNDFYCVTAIGVSLTPRGSLPASAYHVLWRCRLATWSSKRCISLTAARRCSIGGSAMQEVANGRLGVVLCSTSLRCIVVFFGLLLCVPTVL